MRFIESSPALIKEDSIIKAFYQDEYATVDLDESIPCVRLIANGVPRYSEHYRYVQAKRLELIYREIKNFDRLHMLTDSRNAGPVLNEDVQHFRTSVMPAMRKAGIRFLAIVMPSNKFTRLTIKEMTEGTEIITVRCFELMRDARAWLRSKS
jgi:hypothetical protein